MNDSHLPPTCLMPVPWSTYGNPDPYGLVDLDDEGNTLFTIVGKRLSDGDVEIDGDRGLVLDEATLSGLCTLIELAQRGHDDFNYQAENTRDYSEEDVRAAGKAWRIAELTIERIRGVAS